MANDRLAQIAADGMGGKIELLEIPAPIPYDVKACVLEACSEGTTVPMGTRERISTKEA